MQRTFPKTINSALRTLKDIEESFHAMAYTLSEREAQNGFVIQYMFSLLTLKDKQNVLNYLRNNSFSQQEIANYFGISQSTVSRWIEK